MGSGDYSADYNSSMMDKPRKLSEFNNTFGNTLELFKGNNSRHHVISKDSTFKHRNLMNLDGGQDMVNQESPVQTVGNSVDSSNYTP